MPDKTTAHVLACGAMSHLHFDHAGNVRAFAGTGARLICNDKEYRDIAERTNATLVFGHDSDQIHDLRIAPSGAYT